MIEISEENWVSAGGYDKPDGGIWSGAEIISVRVFNGQQQGQFHTRHGNLPQNEQQRKRKIKCRVGGDWTFMENLCG